MGAPGYVAHRFGRAYGPDSSRQALGVALGRPIAGLETDCCLTADGGIALLHDPLLDHSTTLTGWANEHPLAAILESRLRDASGEATLEAPMTLEEILAAVAGRDVLLQLEVKAFADPELAARTARRVCELVERYPGVDKARIEIISFWPEACEIGADHGFATRPIVACAYLPEAFAEWAVERRISGVILEAPYFGAGVVAAIRDAGLSLMSGMVNDAKLAARMATFGPDLISTDRPHELARELAGAPTGG